MAYRRLNDIRHRLESIELELASMITDAGESSADIEWLVIVDIVAGLAGITRDDILGQRRHRRIAWPRQIACYLIRRRCITSLPRIGQLMGRDHTTILHAERAVAKRLLEREPETVQLIAAAERVMGRRGG